MPRKSSAPNNLKRSPFNVREAVGGNIKRHRLTLGWSQQELADRFGVSRAAVSQYEIGTGEVNAGDLPRLADLLGISLLDFFAGSGPSLSPIDLSPIDLSPIDLSPIDLSPVDLSPVDLSPVDLSPVDRQPTEHAEGSWAAESAAMLLRPHEPLVSQPGGRPRDTRHRRPASLAYAASTPREALLGEEELLGEVDIAKEVVKLGSRGGAEVKKNVRTGEIEAGEVQAGEVQAGEVQAGEVQAGEVQAGAAGQVSEGESGAGSSADPLFFRDHQFRVAYAIVPALQQDRSREAVARLAELAGDFLSLSRRDQETLSRVAEALKVQTQQTQTQREHTEEL